MRRGEFSTKVKAGRKQEWKRQHYLEARQNNQAQYTEWCPYILNLRWLTATAWDECSPQRVHLQETEL
jgi:hypothetical protein